jgi:Cu/Ag efflux protein CusF
MKRRSIALMLVVAATTTAAAILPVATRAAAGSILAQASAMADGEVRRIDAEAGKVTLRHGPIPSLDMGPMNMVFRVKDRAMLEKMKVGQKIRFEAAKIEGQLTVIRFEPVP